MRRIDIVPSDCPADKQQKQKTLVLAVAKMMDDYLASDDDKIAVGLSTIGTVISNLEPKLRGPYYTRIGQQLAMAMRIIERDEAAGA